MRTKGQTLKMTKEDLSLDTKKKRKADILENNSEEKSTKKTSFYHQFLNKTGPVALGSKELPVGTPGCLEGLSFCCTGELDSTARQDVLDLLHRYGGRVVGQPSSKVDYAVVGRDPGPSKMSKIKKLGISILDEDQLFDLIRNRSPPSSSAIKNVQMEEEVKPQVLEKSLPVVGKSTELWTTKYAPKNSKEIIGNKGLIEQLANFLKTWKPNTSGTKAALLSGPPGIGKTTSATLVAKECGFDVFELNASDTRSKSSVNASLTDLVTSKSIGHFASGQGLSTKHIIIMDEVDGMGAGDRGGMQELYQIIKKTRIPILCICNDRQSPKVRTLANYCLDLRFHRPTVQMIRSKVFSIAFKEGFKIDVNAADQIISSAQGDIRQIINLLQAWSLNNKSMTFDQSKELLKLGRKESEIGIFDLTHKLFSTSVFRGLSMTEKLGLYFNDYQLLPPFVQENYIRMSPHIYQEMSEKSKSCKVMEALSRAADAISDGDLVDRLIWEKQDFSVMPIHSFFSCVLPASYTSGSLTDRIQFPLILGQISKTNSKLRVLKEIHSHMWLSVSGDKNEIRQLYIPALLPKLTLPLIEEGSQAVDNVISLMDSYNITKEDWDSILDLGIGENNGEKILKKIPPNVKVSLTRTYNKNFHHNPFIKVLGGPKKSKGGSTNVEMVDFEEAVDKNDAAVEEEPEDAEELVIKPKKVLTKGEKGKGTVKKTATKSKKTKK